MPLNPHIINWYLNFLKDRQKIVYEDYYQVRKYVNKGTTQGGVCGPYLFKFYLEIETDHESSMLKCAGDSKILEPFWCHCTDENAVHSNPRKFKELTFQKKAKGKS